MEERRRVPRHRTLKSGKIVVQSGRWVVDCTVRNLSALGALLAVKSLAAIPEKFDLVARDNRRASFLPRGLARRGSPGR